MSITKQYLKTKPACKVTFTLPEEPAEDAAEVAVVGEFNNWDPSALKLKKNKSGSYTATVTLEKDRDYQFRYLVNGNRWLNDDSADFYIPSPVSHEHNSVIKL